MHDDASDTRIALEWDQAGRYWAFPLLDQEWAEFRGLLGRDEQHYSKIDPAHFHIERSAGGEHRVLWTATDQLRPGRAYGLVAVRPKPAGAVLGVPITLLVPIITALMGVASTYSLQVMARDKSPTAGAAASDNRTVATAAALESCKREQAALHEFILPRPGSDRVLYLLGYSHGQRIEAINRLHEGDPVSRSIAMQAENAYIQNAIANDEESIAYATGRQSGQSDANKLLGLGDPKILSGQTHNNPGAP